MVANVIAGIKVIWLDGENYYKEGKAEYIECIHTPYPLWQLVVFHKAIIKHSYSKKQLIYSKYLFQDIKDQLRYDVKDSKHVATLIHSYLVLLEKCEFLDKQTLYRKYIHPFKIENNVLPFIDNKELNSNVELYFSEFNLFAIGWADYYSKEVFFDDDELENIGQAAEYYQNLVLHKIDSSLHIDEGLFKWFCKAAVDNVIELELHEEEFVEYLEKLIIGGQFISQAVYGTFIALIEEKFDAHSTPK